MADKLPAPVQKIADATDAKIKEIEEAAKPDKEKTVEETKDNIVVEPTVKEPEDQKDKKPPVKTDTDDSSEDWKYWKHKYDVLQGKYNVEVKAVQDNEKERSSLKSTVRHLTRRVTEGDAEYKKLEALLEKEKTVNPPKKVEIPESVMSLLSEEERSHFEEEGIDNKSVEIFGKLVKDLISKIKPDNSQSVDLEEIKREVAVSKKNREADFINELEAEIVDWDEINNSVEFNDWLDNPVSPYVNVTRRSAIREAHQSLDHKTAIRMFKDFKETQVKKVEPEPLKINPDEQIEPKSTVGGETKEQPQGRIYTRAEVKQFYTDRTRGKYSAEDAARIDADIVKASLEKRITN
jgi:hypothetical protein